MEIPGPLAGLLGWYVGGLGNQAGQPFLPVAVASSQVLRNLVQLNYGFAQVQRHLYLPGWGWSMPKSCHYRSKSTLFGTV